jgi:hypothetical protein
MSLVYNQANGGRVSQSGEVDVDVGNDHIVIQRRYEALGAFNDLLIAVWFLIGSFFFLNESLVESGTWLFIVGSAQLIIKPLIKLISLLHVNRVSKRST